MAGPTGLALGSNRARVPFLAMLPPSLTAFAGLSVHLCLTFMAILSLDAAVSGPGVPPSILLLYLLTFLRLQQPIPAAGQVPMPVALSLGSSLTPKMWGSCSKVCAAKLSSFILKQLQEHCYVSIQFKSEINKIIFN